MSVDASVVSYFMCVSLPRGNPAETPHTANRLDKKIRGAGPPAGGGPASLEVERVHVPVDGSAVVGSGIGTSATVLMVPEMVRALRRLPQILLVLVRRTIN